MAVSSHQNFLPTTIFSNWGIVFQEFGPWARWTSMNSPIAINQLCFWLSTPFLLPWRQRFDKQRRIRSCRNTSFLELWMEHIGFVEAHNNYKKNTENLGWKTCQDFAVLDSWKLKMRDVCFVLFCVSVLKGSRSDKPGRCLLHGSCENYGFRSEIQVIPSMSPLKTHGFGTVGFFQKKHTLRSEELKHFNILPGELPRVLISEKNFDFFIEDPMFLRERGIRKLMPVFDSCVKIGTWLAILFWRDTCKQTWNYTRSAQLVRNTAPSTGHRAVACNIPARRFAEACRRSTLIATE